MAPPRFSTNRNLLSANFSFGPPPDIKIADKNIRYFLPVIFCPRSGLFIAHEIGELREAMDNADEAEIKDEFGDVLFALVNFGRHLRIDSEAALAGTNEKFRARFHHVERALEASGRTLKEASLEEMEALWQQAKDAK